MIGTLFWTLFHIHALILTNIVQLSPNVVLCYFQQGIYLTFIGYYSLVKELTTLLLMIICGLWSIMNVRSMRRVRDRQLILLLLMDIIIYTLFSFVFAIFLIYQQITQNLYKKSIAITN
ncbi:unnamed protein product [Rotaria sordida]|uniref:Uncharacterized protein n=1 Tax=Rotaria sordida TaxID=392033 RepID=A0A819WQZ0_9BILA|nr:unnamed protein product [Rotaria sordida]